MNTKFYFTSFHLNLSIGYYFKNLLVEIKLIYHKYQVTNVSHQVTTVPHFQEVVSTSIQFLIYITRIEQMHIRKECHLQVQIIVPK